MFRLDTVVAVDIVRAKSQSEKFIENSVFRYSYMFRLPVPILNGKSSIRSTSFIAKCSITDTFSRQLNPFLCPLLDTFLPSRDTS